MKNDSSEAVTEGALKSILEISVLEDRIGVKTREGTQKEFKESFSFNALHLYLRTMAAFANAKGGYIIFGVTDNPRTLKGLEQSHLSQFDNLDRAKLTDGLNEYFSPEIHWEAGTFKLEGKTLGVIYVSESDDKPIVTKKSFNTGKQVVQEGDILYRYNSRSEKIKYPELNRIIIDSRERESQLLLEQFKYLIEAGAKNAAILDLSKNEVRGSGGQKLLIDQKLVDSISFIREGEFSETEGAPTLKIVGEVQPMNTVTVTTDKIIWSAVTSEDIIKRFLRQDPSDSPESYIKAAACGAAAFVPIHFFRSNAGWSVAYTADAIMAETTRSPAKTKLLERLESDEQLVIPCPSPKSTHKSSKKKIEILKRLRSGDEQLVGISNAVDARLVLESIQCLKNDEVKRHFDLYCRVMLDCFNSFYESDSKVANALRRAACRLDIAMYAES